MCRCVRIIVLSTILIAAGPGLEPLTAAEPASKSDALQSLAESALATDVQRTAALVASDAKLLEQILADDLTYGHADGRIETKDDVLGGLLTGRDRYQAVSPGLRTVRLIAPTVALVSGRADLLMGPASAPFTTKVRYLAAYRLDPRFGWQLAAYQSTRLAAEE